MVPQNRLDTYPRRRLNEPHTVIIIFLFKSPVTRVASMPHGVNHDRSRVDVML